MKAQGLSKAKNRSRSLLPPAFQKKEAPTRKTPEIWGRTFDGEQELHRLWDTGEIDTYGKVDYEKTPLSEPSPDPFIGLTEKEKRRLSFGYTPAQDILRQETLISRQQSQPTSKGQRVLDSNVNQLRKKYGVA